MSRFFSKVDAKVDKKNNDIRNSNQNHEIEKKFQQVKSLYEDKINGALTLYSNTSKSEDATSSSDSDRTVIEVACSETIEVVTSDDDDEQTAISKTLKSFVLQRKVKYFFS